jgi:hypothetical protein
MTKLMDRVLPSDSLGPHKLQEHMLSTYTQLRWWLLGLGALFPIALVLFRKSLPAGCEGATMQFFDLRILKSLSAYYHAGDASRSIFVGGLVAIGVILALYKGFTKRENLLLNAAGIFAAIVVFYPTACGDEKGIAITEDISVHGLSAVLFFACIAAVSWFCAEATLELLDKETQRDVYEGFKRRYRWIAFLFVPALPLAWLLDVTLTGGQAFPFWIEVIGIEIFAYYWFTKNREMGLKRGGELPERKALEGRLQVVDGKVSQTAATSASAKA